MDSKDVQGYLANTVRGKDNGHQKLTFDPATGYLIKHTKFHKTNVVLEFK